MTEITDTDLDQRDVGLLDWLLRQAEQNVPEPYAAAAIPVAWLGRTSTDDAQDPTLSLPRQLETSRKALPPGFVIVAKFYDIESGRIPLAKRGQGNVHEQLDIPIARDGGILELLAEAKRPYRRFVAVIVESIERVARLLRHRSKAGRGEPPDRSLGVLLGDSLAWLSRMSSASKLASASCGPVVRSPMVGRTFRVTLLPASVVRCTGRGCLPPNGRGSWRGRPPARLPTASCA